MAAAALALPRAAVRAQPCCEATLPPGYPEKPVLIVVPYPPGGGTDALARVLAATLSSQWNRPVVVDNKAGAGGMIGAEVVVRSPPDGYTILLTNSSLSINAALVRKTFEPEKDLVPVALLAREPLVLVVNPALQVSSVKDLVALAKSKPSSVMYTSAGSGSVSHLAAEFFKATTGAPMNHVPQRGAALALQDIIAGQVGVMFANPVSVVELAASGKVKALAVGGPKRLERLPNVPTLKEAGVGDDDQAAGWLGAFLPAHAPKPLVEGIGTALRAAVNQPQNRERLAAMGLDASASLPPAQFEAFLRAERSKLSQLVRATGLKVD